MISKKVVAITITLCSLISTSCGKYVTETGKASYYADKYDGRKTASGANFSQNKLTAAHNTLPFGTKVKVKNISNNKTVKVIINDRGPYTAGRIIDLSKRGAEEIDMVKQGVAVVEIKYKKKKK